MWMFPWHCVVLWGHKLQSFPSFCPSADGFNWRLLAVPWSHFCYSLCAAPNISHPFLPTTCEDEKALRWWAKIHQITHTSHKLWCRLNLAPPMRWTFKLFLVFLVFYWSVFRCGPVWHVAGLPVQRLHSFCQAKDENLMQVKATRIKKKKASQAFMQILRCSWCAGGKGDGGGDGGGLEQTNYYWC